jgi:hypothetical protein
MRKIVEKGTALPRSGDHLVVRHAIVSRCTRPPLPPPKPPGQPQLQQIRHMAVRLEVEARK